MDVEIFSGDFRDRLKCSLYILKGETKKNVGSSKYDGIRYEQLCVSSQETVKKTLIQELW